MYLISESFSLLAESLVFFPAGSGRFTISSYDAFRSRFIREGILYLVQEGMNCLSGQFYTNSQCNVYMLSVNYVLADCEEYLLFVFIVYAYLLILLLTDFLADFAIQLISVWYTCMIESSATCHNKKRFLYCWARITSKFGRCDGN